MALGVHLRKFITENVNEDQSVTTDSGCFGKLALVKDEFADYRTLYKKKILFEPTGVLK